MSRPLDWIIPWLAFVFKHMLTQRTDRALLLANSCFHFLIDASGCEEVSSLE